MVRRRKRGRAIKRLLTHRATWIIIAFVAAAVLMFVYDRYSVYSTRIGVIRIDGDIEDFRYVSQIKAALEDPRIRAVVVDVNSPGGTVSACFETENQLAQLRLKKPVVVTMGQYATSGAYLISSASDRIFAHSQTITGGLGVIAIWVSYENKFKQEGISYYIWRSGEAKDEFAPWRAPTPEENARIQELVDNLMRELENRIVKNRPMVMESIDNLRDGSTLYGWEAVGYNLIDELGGYEDALHEAAKLAGLIEGRYITVDVAQ